MEKKNPLSDLIQDSMAKVREMVDTNTIVGQPIHTPDGVTLIPISRVSFGMGGGGAAFGSKKKEAEDPNLGAGLGVGVHIDPVAFLIIKDGATRVMPPAIRRRTARPRKPRSPPPKPKAERPRQGREKNGKFCTAFFRRFRSY